MQKKDRIKEVCPCTDRVLACAAFTCWASDTRWRVAQGFEIKADIEFLTARCLQTTQ